MYADHMYAPWRFKTWQGPDACCNRDDVPCGIATDQADLPELLLVLIHYWLAWMLRGFYSNSPALGIRAGFPAGFRFLGGNWVHLGGEHFVEDHYLHINGKIFWRGSSQFLVGRLPPPPPKKKKKKQASRKPCRVTDGYVMLALEGMGPGVPVLSAVDQASVMGRSVTTSNWGSLGYG